MTASAYFASIRRWWRSPIARLTIVGAVLASGILAGIISAAFADPPARSDRIPAALVNDDQPVNVEGLQVHAGPDLVQAVLAADALDWREMSLAEAESALNSGAVLALLHIPTGYSAAIASMDSSAPIQATAEFRTNDATNYFMGPATAAAVMSVEETISNSVTLNFLDEVYAALPEAREQGQAAAVVVGQLVTDINNTATVAQSAATAATEAATASQQAATSITEATGVADQSATQAADLAASTTAAAGSATAVLAGAKSVDASLQTLQNDLTSKGLTDAAAAVGATRTNLTTSVTTPAETLTAQTAADATKAGQLNAQTAAVPPLLAQAATQTAQAVGQGQSAAAAAQTISTTLSTQVAPAAAGLQNSLNAAAAKVPPVSAEQRAAFAQVLAAPVAITTTVANDVATFGTGIATMVLPVALGVGALLLVWLHPGLHRRLLAVSASSWRIGLTTWLPTLTWSAAQSVTAVLLVALFGVAATAWIPLLGVLILTAAALVTLTAWLRAAFGGIGLYTAAVLLAVQAAASGGLFPNQTLGPVFNWLHLFLPMSYAADAIRRTIAGGPLTPFVWVDVLVLAGFTAIGVGLLIATAHWRTSGRTRDLEPLPMG